METPETPQRDADDRELWGRYATTGNGSVEGCPSPNDLAALIEAGADGGDDITGLERHLAECPECREAVADVRELIAAQEASPISAPAGVIARARAIVGDAPVMVIARRLSLSTVGRWGLSAAASIAVCLLGYQAGAQSSAETLPETDIVNELTFGVGIDGNTDLDLLLATGDDGETGS